MEDCINTHVVNTHSIASVISAFVSPNHFLKNDMMAFGTRNTPATFQYLMDFMLNLAKCEFAKVIVT